MTAAGNIGKALLASVSFLSAVFWVQRPVYFTDKQLDRPLVIIPTPTPTPTSSPEPAIVAASTSADVDSSTTAEPSLTPTSSPASEPEPVATESGELETPYGTIHYTAILHDFWAVSYDSSCLGCTETTFTGMKQGYGVVAVDPDVIPLHSEVYVPGYGIGVAGDIGGAVKGEIIDLGFDKLEGQWSARFVDVYLLSD